MTTPSAHTTQAPAEEVVNVPLPPEARAARLTEAEAIVRRDVFWAMGAGVMPVPILDVAAVMAVELKLVRELSNLYNVKFSEGIAKKIIYSLLGSIGVVGLGGLLGGSLLKLIPVFGQALGFVSVPVLSGAIVHSLGRVMVMHFEAGGTLLDLDPKVMWAYFKQEFEKSKVTVAKLHQESKNNPAKASA